MATIDVSLHLMLNRGTTPQLRARQHPATDQYPELAGIVYVTIEASEGRFTLSGTAAQVTGVLDRLRAELAATLPTGQVAPDQATPVPVGATDPAPEAEPTPAGSTAS